MVGVAVVVVVGVVVGVGVVVVVGVVVGVGVGVGVVVAVVVGVAVGGAVGVGGKMMTRLLPLIFLAACTAAPDYSLISDDGPQDKLTRPEPRPERVQNVCPPKSPYAGKSVKAGHEDALCYGETKEQAPEPKEPETECSYNGWQPGVRYALNQKACA